MSASSTPTLWPSREKATARFAASDDLPTPPLPLATASTRQSAGRRITPSRSGAPPRSFCVSACRSSGVITSKESSTPVTPGDAGQRLLDLLLERVAQRAAGDGEDDRERDDAVVQLEVAHHVELGDRTPELRVDHLLERLQNLVAIDLHAASVAPRCRLRRLVPAAAGTPDPAGRQRLVERAAEPARSPAPRTDRCGRARPARSDAPSSTARPIASTSCCSSATAVGRRSDVPMNPGE